MIATSMSRRSFGVMGMASTLPTSRTVRTEGSTATFVLVHGASYGGWCWKHVAGMLLARGHAVTTPTCPGVGELHHLLPSGANLSNHIDTVTDHIFREDLREIVLMASGFGGIVACGVADRIPDVMRRIVVLDGLVIPSGTSAFEQQPAAITRKRLEEVARLGGGIGIPPAPVDTYRIKDPTLAAWVGARLTSQPVGTFQERLILRHPIGNGRPLTYVDCIQGSIQPVADVKRHLKEQGTWTWIEFDAPRDPMIHEPQRLADLLSDLGQA